MRDVNAFLHYVITNYGCPKRFLSLYKTGRYNCSVLFATAKLALLTKMDLANELDGDLKACQRSIQGVHPGMVTLELSAKTGEGMPAWLDYLTSLI